MPTSDDPNGPSILQSGLAPELTTSLNLQNLSKSFGAQKALIDASLRLTPGEKHVLLGSNGAGKSTLGWLLAGRFKSYGGSVSVGEKTIHLTSRAASLRHGIHIVTQEPALAPNLTAAQNLSLGEDSKRYLFGERATSRSYARLPKELLNTFSIRLHLDQRASQLSLKQRQAIDLFRALLRAPSFLVLDEPALISKDEDEAAFASLLDEVARNGIGILLITHHVQRALRVADIVTVMRDGKTIASAKNSETDERQVLEWMFPRNKVSSKSLPSSSPEVLSATHPTLVVRIEDGSGKCLGNFSATPGAVFGITTVEPELASKILRSIAGVEKTVSTQVKLGKNQLCISSPHDAKKVGILYLSPDREGEAGFSRMSVQDNLTFGILATFCYLGIIDRRRQRGISKELMQRVSVPASRLGDLFSSLSGGNQQRVLLGRMIAIRPGVCLLDEPNRGVDVASLDIVRSQIRALTDNNRIVVIASTDRTFLHLVCDNIVAIDAEETCSGNSNEVRF
jgi:ABC-type sugar transport system ATPase subunit